MCRMTSCKWRGPAPTGSPGHAGEGEAHGDGGQEAGAAGRRGKVARSRRPELQGTRGGSGRRASGLALHVEAHSTGATPRQSSGGATYAEVMQELDRVKRELRELLRELQREVKAARESEGGPA